MLNKLILCSILIIVAFLLPKAVLATDFTSTHFKVKDPIISMGSATSTSSSFKLDSSIGQLAISTSTSSGFQLKAGFLYFSEVAAPAPTPAATVAAAGGNFSMYLKSLVKIGILPLLSIEVKPYNIEFDFNGDNKVDIKDFSIFLSSENKLASSPKSFSVFLSSWTEKIVPFVAETIPSKIGTGISKLYNLGKTAAISILANPSLKTPINSVTVTGEYEKPNFIKNVIRFISNIFGRIIKLFTSTPKKP